MDSEQISDNSYRVVQDGGIVGLRRQTIEMNCPCCRTVFSIEIDIRCVSKGVGEQVKREASRIIGEAEISHLKDHL